MLACAGARPPEAYVRGLRGDLARSAAAGRVEATITELVIAAYSYAYTLMVGPGYLDVLLTSVITQEHHDRWQTPLLGRWQATRDGYVYVSPSGEAGRSSRERPPGVDPRDIIPDPKVALEVPGRERTCGILQVLETLDPVPSTLVAKVESGSVAARNALEASADGRRDAMWSAWRARVIADVQTGRDLRRALRERADAMATAHRSLRVDSTVAVLPIVLLELHAAIDADPGAGPRGGSALADRVALTGLGPMGSADGESVLQAIFVAIREGREAAVERAADRCRDRRDALIAAALDGDVAIRFVAALHAALPAAGAAQRLFAMLRDHGSGPSQRQRRARMANDAEERAVRLADSIGRAAVLRELPLITWDRENIAETRRARGDRAAEDVVDQLIEHQYFYPRSLRSDLLDGRRVRTGR